MTGKRAAGSWLDDGTLYRLRGWLYRVTTAGALLAAGYGLIAGERLPLWIALAGAVFGTSTAAVNTSTKP